MPNRKRLPSRDRRRVAHVRSAGHRRSRRALFEQLEDRRMLTAAWQNPAQRLDVNDDLFVSPVDVLIGVNRLNAMGSTDLGERDPDSTEPFLDASGDGLHAPVDVLAVINGINSLTPLVAARLTRDTAPGGLTNRDQLTSIPAVSVGVSASSPMLRAGLGATDPADFVDVSSTLTDGIFEIDEAALTTLLGAPILDGHYVLRLQASSGNNDSEIREVAFTLDRTAPVPTVHVAATTRVTFDAFDVTFDEPLAEGAIDLSSFTLQVAAGPQAGQLVPLQAVDAPLADAARVRLSTRLPDQQYELLLAASLQDPAGNAIDPGAATFEFEVADPTGITSVAPANGEELVSVAREAIVRFDEPIQPASVDPNPADPSDDTIILIANGERVAGRLRVSSTQRFVTFFPDEPLPASTEVRIIVDGNAILGADGLPLDADRNNEPGGLAKIDFRTLPLTRIPGTTVFGFVRDSFAQHPLVGATIRVDAFPDANAVTDADGRFELLNMPAPEFFVHVDGSTATHLNVNGTLVPIDGATTTYPNVGKPFHSVPGQTVQLEMAGQPFDIFLPPVAKADITPLSSTATTMVGFGDAGKAELAQMFPAVDPAVFDLMQVEIAAGSAVDDSGNAAVTATVVPVPPDRIPAPLPPNLNPALVISIQTPGASSFDVPAPLTFPNLEGLAPFEETVILSFDHDAGRWVVNGTGTVTADGQAIVSNGPVINAPGWHFTQSGVPAEFPLPIPWEDRPDDLANAQSALLQAQTDQVLDILSLIPGPVGGIATIVDAVRDFNNCRGFFACAGVAVEGTLNVGLTFLGLRTAITGLRFAWQQGAEAVLDGRTAGEILDRGSELDDLEDRLALAHMEARLHMERLPQDEFDQAVEAMDTELQGGQQRLEELAARVTDQEETFDDVDEYYRSLLDDGNGGLLDPDDPGDRALIGERRDQTPEGGPGNPTLIVPPPTPLIPPDSQADPETPNPPLPDDFPGRMQDILDDRDNDGFITVIVQAPDDPLAEDVGDTLSTAHFIDVPLDGGATVDQRLGDNVRLANDVDIYRISAAAGDVLTINVNRLHRSFAYGQVRLFDQNGVELAVDADSGLGVSPEIQNFVIPSQGDYYIGVSSWDNALYDPTVISADGGQFTGDYRLTVRRWSSSPSLGVLLDEARMNVDRVLSQDSTSTTQLADDLVQSIANTKDQLQNEFIPLATMPAMNPLFVTLVDKATGVKFQLPTNGGQTPSAVLAPDSEYDIFVYDPLTNYASTGVVTTGATGTFLQAEPLILGNADLVDSDNDGLQDAAEMAIGTSLLDGDTDNDGLTDLAEIQQGLDPLGGRAFPTGVIASLPLRGVAKEVVVEGSTLNAERQTAYVATGSHGLAVIDASQFSNPIVLGQLDLPGDAVDVAVDSRRALAAVAARHGGLHIVDVADPMLPVLRSTIDVDARQVELFEGVAYVADESDLVAYDLLSGERIQRLDLGEAPLTGISREADRLYTMDADNVLRSFDLGSLFLRELDSLQLPDGGGKLFVGSGIAYVAARPSNSRGGFVTVDVSQPSSLSLISGSDVPSGFVAAGSAVLPNGSGLAVVVDGTSGGRGIEIVDVSDPQNTNAFVTRFDLPGIPFSAAIGAGIAFVADGSSGLQVVNFLAFDNLGQAPNVTIDTSLLDVDPGTAGIQVEEGTTLPITVSVSDDVQVRNVELLVDGLVIRNDVSFPFDFAAPTPLLAETGSMTVEVRATDTGGNMLVSPPLTLNIVPDTFAPEVFRVLPGSGARRFEGHQTVRVNFSESMDTATLNATSIQVARAETPNAPLTPLDVQFRKDDGEVQFTFNPLAIGDYVITLDVSAITDRAGNAVGGSDLVVGFSAIEDRDPGDTLATALDLGVLDAQVIFEDLIGEDELGNPDLIDVFSLTLLEPTAITAAMSRLDDDVFVEIYADINGDGSFQSTSERLDFGDSSSAGDFSLFEQLPPGTYQIRVQPDRVGVVTDYTLTLTPSPVEVSADGDPGDTIDTARDLGSLSTEQLFSEIVGAFDTADVYAFTLNEPSTVSLSLSDLTDNIEVELFADINDDQQFQISSERLERDDSNSAADFILTEQLPPGTYHFRVLPESRSESTGYTVRLTSQPIVVSDPNDAGPTVSEARQLGTLDVTQSLTDIVGGFDSADLYAFTIATPTQVTLSVTGLNEDIDLELFADVNNDGDFQISSERVEQEDSSSAGDFNLVQELPPGTYHVRVSPEFSDDSTAYSLTLTPQDIVVSDLNDPGDAVSGARDLGLLTAVQTLTDIVGAFDLGDVYEFRIDQPTNVTVNVSGLSEDVDIDLLADRNSDGSFQESSERLEQEDSNQAGDFSLAQQLPPGIYHLRVRPEFGDDASAYDLTLTPQPITVTDLNDPGSEIAGARDLSLLTVEQELTDIVGGFDEGDVYAFTINQPTAVTLSLSGLTEDIEVGLYADVDNDQQFAGSEELENDDSNSAADFSLFEELPPGTYFVRVQPEFSDDATAYTLRLTPQALGVSDPNDPGDSIVDARDLGELVIETTVTDIVGGSDQADVYAFTLTQATAVTFAISGLSDDVDLELFADVNGDQQFQTNSERLDQEDSSAANDFSMDEELGPGVYYVRVRPEFSDDSTLYTLTLTPQAITVTDPNDPGTTIASARNLGTVAAPVAVTDIVGAYDLADLFALTLSEASALTVSVSSLTDDLVVELFADVNGDGLLQPTERLEFDDSFSQNDFELTEQLPPGTYYLQVLPEQSDDSTAYTLGLSRQMLPITDPNDPGVDVPTSRDLGLLSDPRTIDEVMGGADLADVFTVQLNEPTRITLNVTNLVEDAVVEWFVDINGDGALQANERLAFDDSNSAGDIDLVEALPPGQYHLRVRPEAPDDATGYRLTLTPEILSSGSIVVSNTQDSGAGSLRQAILDANESPVPITIEFQLLGVDPNLMDVDAGLPGGDPAGDVWFIRPQSPLPAINNPDTTIVLDGTSQTDFGGDTNPRGPEVALDGVLLTSGSGLRLLSDNNRVQGLNIQRFAGDGVQIDGSQFNVVAGNYVGVDPTGRVDRGNDGNGIAVINGASVNVIGGGEVEDRNIVSGNTLNGVEINNSNNNRVQGNYLGSDASGQSAIPNTGSGVRVAAGAFFNIIGTNGDNLSDANEGNLISGNTFVGLYVFGSGTNFNTIAGNIIGLTAAGNAPLPNAGSGVGIAQGARFNRVGTNGDGVSDDLERNLISGNAINGIFLSDSGTNENVIAGNYVGLDVTGSVAVGNVFPGVLIRNGAQSNRVGSNGDGSGDVAERNVISGNQSVGVELGEAGTRFNVVAGNYIGLDAGGTTAVPNTNRGVVIAVGSSDNVIGGSNAALRNVISGNTSSAIGIFDANTMNNRVEGNYLGTNAEGSEVVPNKDGIYIVNSPNNVIGGSTDSVRNIISGNDSFHGIHITGSDATGNWIANNYIGFNAAGTASPGNAIHGILVNGGASGTIIGSNNDGQNDTNEGNAIVGNGGAGIAIDNSFGNLISRNQIGGNGGLGIDLGADGVTANDAGDIDNGANGFYNFPTLTSVVATATDTTFVGSIQATANTQLRIEFFGGNSADPSGFGEGFNFIATALVTTDGSGFAAFSFTFPIVTPSFMRFISATATSASEGTSEFSQVFDRGN